MITINQIFDFLNKNSGAINAITTFVLAITTIVYSYWTKKIANISIKQLSLYSEPCVTFELISFSPLKGKKIELINSIQICYRINNIGNVPIQYNVEESYKKDKKEDKSKTILYPKQTIEYLTKVYKIETPVLLDKLENFNMKIIYWELNNPKEKRFFSKSIKLENNRWRLINNQAGKI